MKTSKARKTNRSGVGVSGLKSSFFSELLREIRHLLVLKGINLTDQGPLEKSFT